MQDGSWKAARLDKALGNLEWHMKFQNCKVKHLPMIQSDHAPLLINVYDANKEKREPEFKFQAAWLLDDKFEGMIRESWSLHQDFMTNTKNLRHNLMKWNRDVFGGIAKRKKRLLARIEGVQRSTATNYRGCLVKLEKKIKERS